MSQGSPTDQPWPADTDQRHDAGAPEEAFPVPFTMLDAGLLMVWTILAQVLVGVPAVLVGLDLEVEAVNLVVVITAQVATLAGVLGWLAARGALSWRLLGPVRPSWRHVGTGLGLGVVGFFLVFVSAEMLDRAFGPFDAPAQALTTYDYSNVALVVMAVVVAVVLAPLVEEVVYRSVLFQSTRRRLGMFPALMLSSMVFSAIHLEVSTSPPALLGLFILGAWLAAMMHRTGSLVTAIVAHATYNAIVVGLLVAGASATPG